MKLYNIIFSCLFLIMFYIPFVKYGKKGIIIGAVFKKISKYRKKLTSSMDLFSQFSKIVKTKKNWWILFQSLLWRGNFYFNSFFTIFINNTDISFVLRSCFWSEARNRFFVPRSCFSRLNFKVGTLINIGNWFSFSFYIFFFLHSRRPTFAEEIVWPTIK